MVTATALATKGGDGVAGRRPGAEIARMRFEVIIDGMLAVHAKHAVFTALAAVEGLRRADVELGRAELELSAGAEPDAVCRAVSEAVEAAGFRVGSIRSLARTLPTL
jgi:hypothetical protein